MDFSKIVKSFLYVSLAVCTFVLPVYNQSSDAIKAEVEKEVRNAISNAQSQAQERGERSAQNDLNYANKVYRDYLSKTDSTFKAQNQSDTCIPIPRPSETYYVKNVINGQRKDTVFPLRVTKYLGKSASRNYFDSSTNDYKTSTIWYNGIFRISKDTLYNVMYGYNVESKKHKRSKDYLEIKAIVKNKQVENFMDWGLDGFLVEYKDDNWNLPGIKNDISSKKYEDILSAELANKKYIEVLEKILIKCKDSIVNNDFIKLPEGYSEPSLVRFKSRLLIEKDFSTRKLFSLGDFNGDGLIDKAQILINLFDSTYALFAFISKGSNNFNGYLLKQHPAYLLNAENSGLLVSTLEKGKYLTLCGYGYIQCSHGEPEYITVNRQSIWFILPYTHPSASHRCYYWNDSSNCFNSSDIAPPH